MTEPDERFWLGVGGSRDEHWVLFRASSKITSECWLLSVDDPEARRRASHPAAKAWSTTSSRPAIGC